MVKIPYKQHYLIVIFCLILLKFKLEMYIKKKRCLFIFETVYLCKNHIL